MPTVNYLRVIDYKYDATNIYKSHRKGHRNINREHMEAYQYTNQLT